MNGAVRLLTGILLISAVATTGHAIDWFVAGDGDGTTGADWASAYTDLQAAVDAAGSGDTVYIKQGTYAVTAAVTIDGKDLTILGGYEGATPEPGAYTNDPAATVVEGDGASSRVLDIQNCTTGMIKRVTIRNGYANAGAGVYAANTTVTFEDCVIKENTYITSCNGGGLYMSGGSVSLVRCKLRANRSAGTTYGAALHQAGGTLDMDACAVVGNRGFAGTSGGLHITGSAQTRIRNCLLAGNAATTYGAVYQGGGVVSIENCTVEGNSPTGLRRLSGTMTVTNSIVWNNGDDLSGGSIGVSYSCVENTDDTGTGVIHTDPGFLPGYRLPSGSACINAGGDTAANVGLDGAYAETASTDSGLVDLGYHFDAAQTFVDRYVSPTGTDDGAHGTGTGASAYRTVSYALSQAGADTRVHIEAGSYTNGTETFPWSIDVDGIQLLGADAATTIVDGTGAGSRIVAVNSVIGCVLSNLTFRGASVPSEILNGNIRVGGTVAVLMGAGVRVVDCVVRDNESSGGSAHGVGLGMEGGSVELVRCKIRNNLATSSAAGAGLYRYYGNLTMRSCEVVGNQTGPTNGKQGAGLYSYYYGRTRAFNCLFLNNSALYLGFGGGIHHYQGALLVDNCTFLGNSPYGIYGQAGTITVTNSILWDNGDDLYGTIGLSYSCVEDTDDTGTGVIHTDPKLNPRAYLGDGSPCIDTGGDTAANVGLDGLYARTTTTDSGTVDMGYHRPGVYSLTDRYVSPLGTDSPGNGSGPGASAYRTISYALGQIGEDTRVNVEPGIYSNDVETLPLNIDKDGTQLVGTNAEVTVVDAGGASRLAFMDNVVGCVVSNLTFRNGHVTALPAPCLYVQRSDVTVIDSEMRENTCSGYGAAGGGSVYMDGGSVELLRCKLRDNTCSGTTYGGGVHQVQGNLAMSHCLVSGNQLTLQGARYGGGVYAGTYSAGYTRLFDNLFLNNSAASLGGAVHGSGSGTQISIENCTVVGNSPSGIYRGNGTVTVSNSIVWGNGDDLYLPSSVAYSCIEDTDDTGTGVIHDDPQFVSGYYLGAGSPCVNVGGDTAANLGLDGRYSQESATDSGVVDLGYHYPEGFSITPTALYVSTGGDDGDDGSQGSPFRTITHALSVAPAYATIHIEAGSYTNGSETFPLDVAVDGLKILGTNAEVTLIDATGAGERVMTVDGRTSTLISNLTFMGAAATVPGGGLYLAGSGVDVVDCVVRDNQTTGNGYNGVGVSVNGGNVELLRCKLRNNTGTGTIYGGGVYQTQGNLLLDSCELAANLLTGQGGRQGAGAYAGAQASMRLRNCLIVNNAAASGGGGVEVSAATLVLIESCTVAANSPMGIRQLSGTLTVTNCIVWDHADDLDGTMGLSYTCVEDTNDVGTGVVHGDPQFTCGYYLGSGSSCVDAGGDTAAALDLTNLYAETSVKDTGTADLGYHYPVGCAVSALYVSTSGDDGDDGSQGSPFRTIGHALNVAGPNTRIHVEAGTYDNATETFPLAVQDDGIHLLGAGAASTIVDATGAGVRVMQVAAHSDVLFSNLTFRGASVVASGAGNAGGGLRTEQSGVTIVDCEISDNATSGSGLSGAGIYMYGGQVSLLRCKLRNNSASGTTYGGGIYQIQGSLSLERCVIAGCTAVRQGGGLYSTLPGELRMLNCLVVSNALNAGWAAYGDGVEVSGGTAATLEHVTIADNDGVGLKAANNAATVHNSILWGNGVDSTGTVSMSYSCYSNSTEHTDLGGNITEDPEFIDRVYYHLKSRGGAYVNTYFTPGSRQGHPIMSPAIDAGDPASDYSKEPDSPKGGVNMGAYGNTEVASNGLPPGGTLFMVR